MPRKKQTFKPHIVHPRHSFKKLPTHHTSYALSAFLLLIVMVFSLSWTSFVSGATAGGGIYTILAKVPAEPLTDAASIEVPFEGSFKDYGGEMHTKHKVITVKGSCPDASYVTLTRNDVFAGTAICDGNGHWELQVSLISGSNVLRVQAYNFTDDIGPPTPSITVYYDPPAIIEHPDEQDPEMIPKEPKQDDSLSNENIGSTPNTRGRTTTTPLVLSGGFNFVGVRVGNELIQTFTISGGQLPYAISVDWGDGVRDVVSRSKAGEFTITHIYDQPGTGPRNSYIIRLVASDNQVQSATLQTMAIVTAEQNGGAGAGTANSGGSGLFNSGFTAFDKFWQVAGPVAGMTFIALGSFWLGERRELEILRKKLPQKHRHRHA